VVGERVERGLIAILAADVAGHIRLMGTEREGTPAQLKAHRRGLVDSKIFDQRGRIVKITVKGMLVEFASVVDALRCAIDVQREMVERNAQDPSPTDPPTQFSISQNGLCYEDADCGLPLPRRLFSN